MGTVTADRDILTLQDLEGIDARSLGRLARMRKEAGRFDPLTLACYRRSAGLSRDASSLVAWLTFRRELGRPLPSYALPLLERVRWRLGPRAWLDACHLAAECDGSAWRLPPAYGLFAGRFCAMSATLAAARAGTRRVRGSPFLAGVAAVVTEHSARHRACIDQLRSASRICVVGNAASMNGCGLGAAIDAHDCVVRFNQFLGPHTRAEDVGTRTHVWVRMPGVPRPGVPMPEDWVVLSGPDVRFRSSNWQAMAPVIAAGLPILTVPLACWREVVAQLGAPPSAGVLFLAWLRSLRAQGLAGVGLTGFSRRVREGEAYHHAVPGKQPGLRHEWIGERALLADWVARDGAFWLEDGECHPS
ncbi:MAG: glycosyltransferase family 29 protein [Pseudomonadota bacterium]